MFNKLLIASASCINEFASEVPQSVFFSIDTSLAQRIRELAAYVKENDLAICILGLESAHSDPGFLVRSNAAFGWIALFSLPHQNLTLVGFSDATLSR